MGSYMLLVSLCSLLLILLISEKRGLQAEEHGQLKYSATQLLVFGDSYVDTGNSRKEVSSAWRDPYGISFPGKPSGRFSDGRVLTDYIAMYLGVKSPVAYKMKKMRGEYMKKGMNFAYGGTGVFDTSVTAPNMTTQIDFLEQLIKQKVYTATDLSNSVALVSVAGNDYDHYLASNRFPLGMLFFISSVVNQTTINLKRIHELGVKNILVTGLEPLGCLPLTTSLFLFQSCIAPINAVVALHNSILNQAVTNLNQDIGDDSTFVVLDLYESFMSVLNNPSTHSIEKPLQPCCVGTSSEYRCGSVDENNVKKYNVCDDPKSAFFWDMEHPTQAGWQAVSIKLFQQLQY